ncbi:MAG: IS5 family transposase [Pegethrix bostrychoides GSE-TBD4-15B]|jgi:putative transposase|uniref:IS5 family transposase n=1 Tax=Pegethrix bostrychoides GSE-TBD4-15B TaxID=2839662 RepID=A0A951PFY0_9CYAN|nr:IS5 family transposase [Pegethrix bostrychoides GSE-TBD4-15B]
MTSSYRTDLTDEQWELLSPLIPPAKPGGRPRTVDMRAVVNAIFYLLVTGCAWELLPHDFPKPKTVYHYFRQWRIEGDWERIHDKLRQWVRVSDGRMTSPSAMILDSQSVKSATMVHEAVGYDGGKRVKGRKRHLLVDTMGLMILVVVTAASVPEREGAKLVFEKLNGIRQQFMRLVLIWVDGGYEGAEFMRWVMDHYRWIIETVKRSDTAKGFVVLPKRWIVERRFGWWNWCRRLSKDYEGLPKTSEAMIQVAMIRVMLRRLA